MTFVYSSFLFANETNSHSYNIYIKIRTGYEDKKN